MNGKRGGGGFTLIFVPFHILLSLSRAHFLFSRLQSLEVETSGDLSYSCHTAIWTFMLWSLNRRIDSAPGKACGGPALTVTGDVTV